MRRFTIKRIYDDPDRDDGYRVLVDRLWPRGISKERAAIDLWAKELAPSAGLRTAFHRGELDFKDFEARYRAELTSSHALVDFVSQLPSGRITLLTAVKDWEHSHVPVLYAALE